MDDCTPMKLCALDDPGCNRTLDFYLEPVNESARGKSSQSVSTPSDQSDSDWVVKEVEMLRQMIRAQSYELRQVEIRYESLRASCSSMKGRHELMLKSQRVEMEKKAYLLEAELWEQVVAKNCKPMYLFKIYKKF